MSSKSSRPSRCPHCNYALPGLDDAFCPECRQDLDRVPEGLARSVEAGDPSQCTAHPQSSLKSWARRAFQTLLFSLLAVLILAGVGFALGSGPSGAEPALLVVILLGWLAFMLALVSGVGLAVILALRLLLAVGSFLRLAAGDCTCLPTQEAAGRTPSASVPTFTDEAVGGVRNALSVGGDGSPPDSINQGGESPRDHVENVHVEEIRYYTFLVWVLISLPTTSLPTVLTLLTSSPRAGLEEFVGVRNVVALTYPLTLAVMIVSGWLWYAMEHPEVWPRKPADQARLWAVLGGVILGSMLLGAWAGAVRVPEEVTQTVAAIPEGTRGLLLRGFVQQAAHDKKAAAVAVLVGAAASLGIYFKVYGFQLFLYSMLVGTLLGWLWAVKIPAIIREKAGEPESGTSAERRRQQRLLAGAAIALIVTVCLLYQWGGGKAIVFSLFALSLLIPAAVGALEHLKGEALQKGQKPIPPLVSAGLAAGALACAYFAYQSHYDVRYEARVVRPGDAGIGYTWTRRGPVDRVYLRNTSVMPLTGVQLTVQASEANGMTRFFSGKTWKQTFSVPRLEPGEEVVWETFIDIDAVIKTTDSLNCDQNR